MVEIKIIKMHRNFLIVNKNYKNSILLPGELTISIGSSISTLSAGSRIKKYYNA